MIPITRVTCIYASKAQSWTIELTLDGDKPARTRLTLRGPEHVETFLDAFDDCDRALYDEASGEVRFVFDGDEEEDADDEEDEDEDEDDEEDDGEDGAKTEAGADDAREVEARPGENDGGFAGEITTKECP